MTVQVTRLAVPPDVKLGLPIGHPADTRIDIARIRVRTGLGSPPESAF